MIDRIVGWVRRHAPAPSTNHLISAILVSVLILSLAAVTLVFTIQGRSDDQAREASSDVTACRSLYRAGVDAANDLAADAESERADAFSDVILAAIADDAAALQRAAARLNKAKDATDRRRAGVRRASRAYASAVRQSAQDQAAFVVRCKRLIP